MKDEVKNFPRVPLSSELVRFTHKHGTVLDLAIDATPLQVVVKWLK